MALSSPPGVWKTSTAKGAALNRSAWRWFVATRGIEWLEGTMVSGAGTVKTKRELRKLRRIQTEAFTTTLENAAGLAQRERSRVHAGRSHYEDDYEATKLLTLTQSLMSWDPHRASLSTKMSIDLRREMQRANNRLERPHRTGYLYEAEGRVAKVLRAAEADDVSLSDEDICEAANVSKSALTEMRRTRGVVASLDQRLSEDSSSTTLGDMFAESRDELWVSHTGDPHLPQQQLDALWEATQDTPATRWILVRRLGLAGDGPATLLEVATELGMSGEMVRTAAAKAQDRARCLLAQTDQQYAVTHDTQVLDENTERLVTVVPRIDAAMQQPALTESGDDGTTGQLLLFADAPVHTG